MFKLTVTMPDDTQDVYAEGTDPFMDILGFSYNGETGFFTVQFAAEGPHLKAKNYAKGCFEQTYGTGQWKRIETDGFQVVLPKL